ncbi:hypothetical protein MtrunA17_Chr6g0469261 [Medicago truncatula]|uniref:Transmembrane protein n=1 Tax=Medicago truncatula TaxID=3880 RepID=A0A396HFX5_MEDTR|nr:hypothetical protein MtrunA17_Chr6g0469261 [Medicago truncatula]
MMMICVVVWVDLRFYLSFVLLDFDESMNVLHEFMLFLCNFSV